MATSGLPCYKMFEDLTIDNLSQLNINDEESEEEIEVIYVENLTGEEIVNFARYGEVDIVTELLRSGLNVRLFEAFDSRGNSALHMAAANGHTGIFSRSPSLIKIIRV